MLSRYNLKNIESQEIATPAAAVFDLPEKVLQFGTGVLLRGLPDYFIDKANRQDLSMAAWWWLNRPVTAILPLSTARMGCIPFV